VEKMTSFMQKRKNGNFRMKKAPGFGRLMAID